MPEDKEYQIWKKRILSGDDSVILDCKYGFLKRFKIEDSVMGYDLSDQARWNIILMWDIFKTKAE